MMNTIMPNKKPDESNYTKVFHDVFISYSRRDKEFVLKLRDALVASNRNVWLDLRDIPYTADWQEEIYRNIVTANNVLCVLSPDFIQSPNCRNEVAYAVMTGKRLVRIEIRDINDQELLGHQELAPLYKIQSIPFQGSKDFDHTFKKLVEALDTDLDHVQKQRQWGVRALEWENKGHNNSYVLLGRNLEEAEHWRDHAIAMKKEPAPTPLQIQYIALSRRVARSRQRIALSAVSFGFIITLILSVLSYTLYQGQRTATQQALDNLATAVSRQLAAQTTNHLNGNLDLSLLLSVEANRIHNTLEARDSLLKALEYQPHLAAMLPSLSSGADSIAFSPGGKMLAVGGQDQTFTLWDVASRRPLFPPIRDQLIFPNSNITQAPVPVDSLAFSPDGKVLATGTDFFDGTFRLWDVPSKRPISPPISVPRGVSRLAFDPKGDILAVGNTDGTFSLWDVASQGLLGTHLSWTDANDPHEISSNLVFSPDGTVLAVSNNDAAFSLPGTFTLWDVRSQRLLGTHQTSNRSRRGSPLAFSPDGNILAVGGEYGSATLWDVKSQHPVGAPLTNTTVSEAVGSVAEFSPVAFNPVGQILAIGSSNGTITFRDMATHQPVDEITTNTFLTDMIFSPDGGLLATIGDGNNVNLWHVFPTQSLTHLIIGAREPVKPFISPGGTEAGFIGGYYTAFSPDGHTAAVMYCRDGYCINPTMQIWSTTGHQQLGEAFTSPLGTLGAPVFALSPDNKFLAVAGCPTQDCASRSGELLIWNITSHQLLGNPIMTDLPLDKVAYSPDGKVLAAYGDNLAGRGVSGRYGGDVIYLWDVKTGQFLGSIGSIGSDSKSFVGNAFAFKPNSDILAAPYCSHFTQNACDHVQIGLWDSQNPSSGKQVIGDPNIPFLDNIIFSPTGAVLATTKDNGIVLWDVATGKRLRETSVGYPIAFTPDGTMLITSATYCTAFNDCRDPAIQLLDVDTLNPVGPPLAMYINYTVEGIEITHNMNPLYGWSVRNGVVVTWDFNRNSWQTLACQIANRNLTLSEWNQYISYIPYHKTCPNLPGS
jgi:WD40 repeat protein